jgi:ribose transport system substrate-binding protein
LIPKLGENSNDFWTTVIEGAKNGAKEYEVNLTIMAPNSEMDYEYQNELIQKAIELNPDAIILAPLHFEKNTENAKKIKENGIHLVLLDSYLNEEIQDCFIGTDNYQAGVDMGELMSEYVTENSQIAIVSHIKGSSTAMERERGIRDGLAKDEIKITSVLYSNADYNVAYDETKKLLERNLEISLIGALNLHSTVGSARAVNDLRLTDKVTVIGFDNESEAIQLMTEGVISELVVQKPFNMGFLGIENAVKLVKGEEIDSEVNSGIVLIDTDNIYKIENQKLLFPF